jgi:MoaA/NifB/PqqE/SkfB family radical SAM enzyme
MAKISQLTINLRLPYTLCNYRCEYCSTKHDEDVDEQYIHKLWQSLTRLPLQLGIVIETLGEVLISDKIKKFILDLTKAENIDYVNITTNLSIDKNEFKKLLKKMDKKKFSLNCTLHDLIPDLDEFHEKVALIKKMGFNCIIHYVAHPQRLIEIPYYMDFFKKLGLRMTINSFLGTYQNKSYPEEYNIFEKYFLKEFYFTEEEYMYSFLGKSPLGKLCCAGRKSVFIDCNGDVFRCRDDHSKKLGNVFTEFKLFNGNSKCKLNSCRCPRDFLWLKEIDDKYERTNSFRLYYRKK